MSSVKCSDLVPQAHTQQGARPRDATRSDGARGKKQVWRPHVWTRGLLEAIALYWRKYLWHGWDFLAPHSVIRRPHSDSAPGELCSLDPLATPLAVPFWLTKSNFFLSSGVSGIIYLLPVSQWKPRDEQEPLEPDWFVWSGLALVWSTPLLASVKGCWHGLPAHVHALTRFVQIGQSYLKK